MSPDNLDIPDRPQPLMRLDGQPAFDEQWQAQVLAMVDTLITGGDITPSSWSEVFGADLKSAHKAGAPDDLDTYYSVALKTLEKLVTGQCDVTNAEITARCEAWEQAYLRTPHGKPVEL